MKVKELIQLLSKANQDVEVFIDLSSRTGNTLGTTDYIIYEEDGVWLNGGLIIIPENENN
jgi:hypothetical protein